MTEQSHTRQTQWKTPVVIDIDRDTDSVESMGAAGDDGSVGRPSS